MSKNLSVFRLKMENDPFGAEELDVLLTCSSLDFESPGCELQLQVWLCKHGIEMLLHKKLPLCLDMDHTILEIHEPIRSLHKVFESLPEDMYFFESKSLQEKQSALRRLEKKLKVRLALFLYENEFHGSDGIGPVY